MGRVGRRPLFGGALATALAGAGDAWAQGQAPGQGQGQPAGNELRLGALFPFSGSLALLGDESFRGVEIAAEERNAAGGIGNRPIRLLKAEAVDAAQATAEVRRLTGQERVAAMLGTFSSPLSFAATQVAELQGVAYFELGAISDQITDRGFRYVFRTCPRASDFAREAVNAVPDALAGLWGTDAAGLKLAILHEDGLYGQAVAGFQEQQARSRGLAVVEKLAYATRSVDLAAVIARLRSAAADVVLHTGYQNDIVMLYRGLREAGWKPRMIIGSGAGYSLSDTARAIGPEFDGTMNVDFTQFEVNERAAPGVRQFVELYKRKYGADPRSGHSLANYAGARIAFDALQRAGSLDKDRVRAAVLATDIAEGGTPTGWGARFDEKGQNQRARPFLLQWQGGRQLTVLPAEAAVTQLKPNLGETP